MGPALKVWENIEESEGRQAEVGEVVEGRPTGKGAGRVVHHYLCSHNAPYNIRWASELKKVEDNT